MSFLPAQRQNLERKIYFASGSDALDNTARQTLDELLAWQAAHPEQGPLQLRAYTDDVGDPLYNRALAERRAQAIKVYLAKSKLEISHVELMPQVKLQADNEEALAALRQEYRRVELRLRVREPKDLEAFYSLHRQEALQVYKHNSQADIFVDGKKGGKVHIPAGALCDAQGQPYQGEVEVRLIEAYTFEDMILQNLQTVSEEGTLQTGGMVYVEVVPVGGSEALKLRADMPMTVDIPSNKPLPRGMRVYTAERRPEDQDKRIVWKETEQSFEEIPFKAARLQLEAPYLAKLMVEPGNLPNELKAKTRPLPQRRYFPSLPQAPQWWDTQAGKPEGKAQEKEALVYGEQIRTYLLDSQAYMQYLLDVVDVVRDWELIESMACRYWAWGQTQPAVNLSILAEATKPNRDFLWKRKRLSRNARNAKKGDWAAALLEVAEPDMARPEVLAGLEACRSDLEGFVQPAKQSSAQIRPLLEVLGYQQTRVKTGFKYMPDRPQNRFEFQRLGERVHRERRLRESSKQNRAAIDEQILKGFLDTLYAMQPLVLEATPVFYQLNKQYANLRERLNLLLDPYNQEQQRAYRCLAAWQDSIWQTYVEMGLVNLGEMGRDLRQQTNGANYYYSAPVMEMGWTNVDRPLTLEEMRENVRRIERNEVRYQAYLDSTLNFITYTQDSLSHKVKQEAWYLVLPDLNVCLNLNQVDEKAVGYDLSRLPSLAKARLVGMRFVNEGGTRFECSIQEGYCQTLVKSQPKFEPKTMEDFRQALVNMQQTTGK